MRLSDHSVRDPGARAPQEMTAAVILDLLITRYPSQLSFDELVHLVCVDLAMLPNATMSTSRSPNLAGTD